MSNLIDKETKAKWVEALRSGQYQQLKGALFDGNNSYCCLGVLQRIREEEVPVAKKTSTGGWKDDVDKDFYTNTFEGLVPYWWSKLACMNDGGHSFLEIADVIEKEVETSD